MGPEYDDERKRWQGETDDTASFLVRGRSTLHRAPVDTPGKRLRHARTQRGLGSRELAGLAGVSPAWISKYEHDKRKDVEAKPLSQVAGALRVRPEWLQTGTGPMEVPDEAPQGPPDPYPERGRALQRLAGLLAPEVETSLREMIPGTERYQTELAWVAYAVRVQREHEEGFDATSPSGHRHQTGEQARVSSDPEAQRKKNSA
jgi:transcriptional regulator with XRE-family HTH domain